MKIIITIIFIFLATIRIYPMEDIVRTHTLPTVTIVAPTIEQEIFRTVLECGYDTTMAKLMVAQSRHETGNWKSRLARKANNVFGMHSNKNSKRSIGTTIAEKNNKFAVYDSVESSTLEALDWLSSHDCPFKFKSSSEYAKWLKSKGYYEDSVTNYSNALRVHLKQLKV